jgi:hypothetical protein
VANYDALKHTNIFQKAICENTLTRRKLPLIFYILLIQSGFNRHLFDQFLVVIDKAKAFGQRLCIGSAAAAELSADCDNLFSIVSFGLQ